MSYLARNQAVTVGASGANIVTGAASANAAIPNTSASQKPRFVRLHATVAAYVRCGTTAGVTAAAGDMIVDPATPIVLNVSGYTHIAAIQVAAAGILNITPLED